MSDVRLEWAKNFARAKNAQWKHVSEGNNIVRYKNIIGSDHFESMFKQAYANKGKKFRDVGISYRVNPLTGKNEMFVAGSSGMLDWVFNLTNGIFYGAEKVVGPKLDAVFKRTGGFVKRPKFSGWNPDRNRQTLGIAREAKRHNVDVMYGHSRGGALVADADFSGTKFGLDAAMLIAENTDMVNFRRPGIFDGFLGLTGKKNYIVPTGHGIHWAYGH